VPITSSSSAIGTGGLADDLRAHLLHRLDAGVQRARGAPGLLDHQQVDGAAAGVDVPAQFFAVEALAAQRDQQHGADVRMRAQALHHLERVLVRVAAGESR
jgi:hypothetical protein